jgi:transposase
VNHHSTIEQRVGPDPILLEGIRDGRRQERESVNRALSNFPELRVGSIWTRLRRLRSQQREEAHIGVPFKWTTDLDETLYQTHAEKGLRAAVTEIEFITGWPRNAISRRARKLGLRNQPVGSRRRWRMAEFRFALESVSHMSAGEIAEVIGRSEKAVREMIGQRGIEGRFQDGYSLRELAEMLHVRRTAVRKWVRSGVLRRKKNGRISEESLQAFLASHQEYIRWSSLDGHTLSWIAQLIQEAATIKAPEPPPGAKHQSMEEPEVVQSPTLAYTVSNTHEVGPSGDPGSHDTQAHAANPGL